MENIIQNDYKKFYTSINKCRTNLLVESIKDLNIHKKNTFSKINHKTIKEHENSYNEYTISVTNPIFTDAVELNVQNLKNFSLEKLKEKLYLDKIKTKSEENNEKRIARMKMKIFKFEISNKEDIKKMGNQNLFSKKSLSKIVDEEIERKKISKGSKYLMKICARKIEEDVNKSSSTGCSFHSEKNF